MTSAVPGGRVAAASVHAEGTVAAEVTEAGVSDGAFVAVAASNTASASNGRGALAMGIGPDVSVTALSEERQDLRVSSEVPVSARANFSGRKADERATISSSRRSPRMS